MEEEDCEMQSEDKALSDKNKKRRFKTPDQVKALEKFYSEHKYPSEELKSQFAVSLGLTEKQISGWFCHRRLKDKRGEVPANGKHDRSSGIIAPDHGSGHKQDSCGSTKEGGTQNFEHKEVQSRGFSGQNPIAADLAYERDHNHDDGKNSDLDDTSSGSSLPPQRLHHHPDPPGVAAFSYLPETENVGRGTNLVGIRPRPGPSGYLKLKAKPENSAITSVKTKMGRHYVEDGPPLSVEFDPLPPGAFESSMNNPDNDFQFLGVPDLQQSPDLVTSCDAYIAEMTPRNPHLDGSNFRVERPSRGHGNYMSHKSVQKPVFSNRSAFSLKRKSSNEFDGFSSETPVYDESYKMIGQHDFHGGRKDGFVHSGKRERLPYNPGNVRHEQAQRRRLEPKYPNLLAKPSESFDMETRRMFKDDKFIGEMKGSNRAPNLATVQGGKRVWEEYLEQRSIRKASKAEPPIWTNQTKRTGAADIPSSFSEDETAETDSSGD